MSLEISSVLRRMLAGGALPSDVAVELLARDRETQLRQAMMVHQLPPGGVHRFAREIQREYARTAVALPDGTVGYFERGTRTDDCFTACLATCLQVPIDEVPDPRIDERLSGGEAPEEIARSAWDGLARWLASRGLRIVMHESAPVELPRWIGTVEFPGHFNDHSVVMSGGEILFDPVDHSRHERRVCAFTLSDVGKGFSFQRLPATR